MIDNVKDFDKSKFIISVADKFGYKVETDLSDSGYLLLLSVKTNVGVNHTFTCIDQLYNFLLGFELGHQVGYSHGIRKEK